MKLAISVDADVHAEVVREAQAAGESVSAWMTEAARRRIRIRDGLRAIEEWESEHGALTDAEMDAARERLRAARSRHAKRRSRR